MCSYRNYVVYLLGWLDFTILFFCLHHTADIFDIILEKVFDILTREQKKKKTEHIYTSLYHSKGSCSILMGQKAYIIHSNRTVKKNSSGCNMSYRLILMCSF